MSTTDGTGTARRMKRLWERMTALYGGRWELEYGPCVAGDGGLAPLAMIWAEALEAVPNDGIARGLRACLDSGETRTPSLPAFLRLCGRTPGPARGDPSHRLAPPRQDIRYQDTPAAICERLAASYREMAYRELEPRLAGLPADSRAAAVRAYWMSVMPSISPTGASIAKRYQEQETAP